MKKLFLCLLVLMCTNVAYGIDAVCNSSTQGNFIVYVVKNGDTGLDDDYIVISKCNNNTWVRVDNYRQNAKFPKCSKEDLKTYETRIGKRWASESDNDVLYTSMQQTKYYNIQIESNYEVKNSFCVYTYPTETFKGVVCNNAAEKKETLILYKESDKWKMTYCDINVEIPAFKWYKSTQMQPCSNDRKSSKGFKDIGVWDETKNTHLYAKESISDYKIFTGDLVFWISSQAYPETSEACYACPDNYTWDTTGKKCVTNSFKNVNCNQDNKNTVLLYRENNKFYTQACDGKGWNTTSGPYTCNNDKTSPTGFKQIGQYNKWDISVFVKNGLSPNSDSVYVFANAKLSASNEIVPLASDVCLACKAGSKWDSEQNKCVKNDPFAGKSCSQFNGEERKQCCNVKWGNPVSIACCISDEADFKVKQNMGFPGGICTCKDSTKEWDQQNKQCVEKKTEDTYRTIRGVECNATNIGKKFIFTPDPKDDSQIWDVIYSYKCNKDRIWEKSDVLSFCFDINKEMIEKTVSNDFERHGDTSWTAYIKHGTQSVANGVYEYTDNRDVMCKWVSDGLFLSLDEADEEGRNRLPYDTKDEAYCMYAKYGDNQQTEWDEENKVCKCLIDGQTWNNQTHNCEGAGNTIVDLKKTQSVDLEKIKKAQDKLDSFFNWAKANKSGWKTADGKFNTTRLASDITAGVVLGTVGGVVSGVVIKKKQVEKGFDALHCTVGGQSVADWGDEFTVGFKK